jgi:hypothetical protein
MIKAYRPYAAGVEDLRPFFADMGDYYWMILESITTINVHGLSMVYDSEESLGTVGSRDLMKAEISDYGFEYHPIAVMFNKYYPIWATIDL